jgi:hypothetical protein
MKEKIRTRICCWMDRPGLKWSVQYTDITGRFLNEKHFATKAEAESFERGLNNGN